MTSDEMSGPSLSADQLAKLREREVSALEDIAKVLGSALPMMVGEAKKQTMLLQMVEKSLARR